MTAHFLDIVFLLYAVGNLATTHSHAERKAIKIDKITSCMNKRMWGLVEMFHLLFNFLILSLPTPIETNSANIKTFSIKPTDLVDFHNLNHIFAH